MSNEQPTPAMTNPTQFKIGKAYASDNAGIYMVTGITAKLISVKCPRGKEYRKVLRTSTEGVEYFRTMTGPYVQNIKATDEMSLEIFNSMSS